MADHSRDSATERLIERLISELKTNTEARKQIDANEVKRLQEELAMGQAMLASLQQLNEALRSFHDHEIGERKDDYRRYN
jgi:hypothetical protein